MVEVLPNGHLLVTGEKQIGVNQNVDVLRFTGTCTRTCWQPNSIISSTQVANVRVESRGRGQQNISTGNGLVVPFLFELYPFLDLSRIGSMKVLSTLPHISAARLALALLALSGELAGHSS